MAEFMKPWTAQTYALTRIMVGLLFLSHGLSKLVGFPVPPPPEAPAFIIYAAGSIELGCGLLVALGHLERRRRPRQGLARGLLRTDTMTAGRRITAERSLARLGGHVIVCTPS